MPAGVDIILVGDSAGVVVAGHDTTLPVTMDEMIYHTRAVRRAEPKALVVADMPFMSYQAGGRGCLPQLRPDDQGGRRRGGQDRGRA